MRSCEEVTRLVSETLDRPLSLRLRLSISLHLFLCKYCRRFRRQVLFIREVLRHGGQHLDAQDLPVFASLSPEVRARIKQVLARPV